MQDIAHQLKISDIVSEYNRKILDIETEILEYENACSKIRSASIISGMYSNCHVKTESICKRIMEKSLLQSAWNFVYSGLNINRVSSASDRKKFQQNIENPIPFTIENIRSTFGDYLLNPRINILRGLAEVFCKLDPSYKNHEKVKIGVKGLPKRVILPNVSKYGIYGKEFIKDILNALALYQGKPLIEYEEIYNLLENGDCLIETRGVRLKIFKNGNGHLFFEPKELEDINFALAEFYGNILPDTPDENPKKKPSTELSKDLQFYPTPLNVIESIINDIYILKNKKVLEPSCGDGRFMEKIKKAGGEVFGVEVDFNLAEICRKKGFPVFCGNFLEMEPEEKYDFVIMNPPFYGRYYEKHVSHAFKFLKKGGTLIAILPITARDNEIFKGSWKDLPIGSFKESGTNINTTVLKMKK